MFTGIIQGKAEVINVVPDYGSISFQLEVPSPFLPGIQIGASVSIDGVCLTLTKREENILSFDVMLESLSRTTLAELKAGDCVNIERSAKDGAEIGGHPMSGHVDCTAEVIKIARPSNNCVLTFRTSPEWMKYIFSKGYIGLNGASLTIAAVDKDTCEFDIWFIPETLRVTTFASKTVGDSVNLEIERNTQVIVDTVRDFLQENAQNLVSAQQSSPKLAAAG